MLDIDPKKLEKLAVEAVVDKILDLNDEDGQYDQFSRLLRLVDTEVEARIDRIFAERAAEIIEQRVQEAIEQGFEREFQEYDNFGKPIGDPQTIAARLNSIVGDYWSARVHKNTGKPETSPHSSVSRAEYVLTQSLGEDFAAQFKQQAANAAAGLKDGLRDAMRAQMDAALANVFHVQSATDKAEGRRR